MSWQQKSETFGLSGQVIVKARFAGEKNIGIGLHSIHDEFSAGTAGQSHSFDTSARITDSLDLVRLQYRFGCLSRLLQGLRFWQFSNPALADGLRLQGINVISRLFIGMSSAHSGDHLHSVIFRTENLQP